MSARDAKHTAADLLNSWTIKGQKGFNQGRLVNPDRTGFIYMLSGDKGVSNTDPWAVGKTADNHWIETGSHVMIVGPTVKTMVGYSRAADPDPTKPYVMWPGSPYEHLMLPVR